MNKNDVIYLAGHTGLIGSSFSRRLTAEGFRQVATRTRAELDLGNSAAVRQFFESIRPKIVILCAGRVGGIGANVSHPAAFIVENLSIQLNVLQAAYATCVERVIFFGSSCMYPRHGAQPMSETALLTGAPEITSLPYAMAKLAGLTMCQAYNQELKALRYLPLIPNNAYGPNDNFDPNASHVLSALIARIDAAKRQACDRVTLWGTGTPRREFVYADDIVDACLFLLHKDAWDFESPLNIGTGTDHSIRELAEMVSRVIGFSGKLEFDASKPDGAPRKLLDSSRLRNLGWAPKVELEAGIRRTYDWYLTTKKLR